MDSTVARVEEGRRICGISAEKILDSRAAPRKILTPRLPIYKTVTILQILFTKHIVTCVYFVVLHVCALRLNPPKSDSILLNCNVI